MSDRSRWPGWVYSTGEEPDYRFSFANERTFLAWIRTALALLAAAVAVDVVNLDISRGMQVVLVTLLAVLGMVAAIASWVRWALSERSIRERRPLPSFGFAVLVAIGLVVAGIVFLLASL
ncbi:YidH family protein [Nocardioides sambongensis]|uniref:YidH family protein n=1 Tax=Nocardioides sambongensis TaxID=2589074 RepID=UPI00112771CF|nr:DUF202 domain-containing protein [Nocardioides sambongensis]